MKRRDFLKGLAGVVAGTVVVPSVVKAKPGKVIFESGLWMSEEDYKYASRNLLDPTKEYLEAEAKAWEKKRDEIILKSIGVTR